MENVSVNAHGNTINNISYGNINNPGNNNTNGISNTHNNGNSDITYDPPIMSSSP
jgi:hypothetical protein